MKNYTLVVGASLNTERYSNKAICMLRKHQQNTLAIGLRKGVVADVNIDVVQKITDNIDSVTLYLNPKRQEAYYDYIVKLKPRRVIFNPGTENTEFVKILSENNIESEIACTLVLLSTNQY